MIIAPVVLISKKNWDKIMCLSQMASPNEISGVGSVSIEGNFIIINDNFIPRQKTSTGFNKTISEGENGLASIIANHPAPENLLFQWHSHGKSSVFFSGTDLATIEKFLGDIQISLVVNERAEYVCRVDIYSPIRIAVEPVIKIISKYNEALMKDCENIIKNNVFTEKRRVFKVKQKKITTNTVVEYQINPEDEVNKDEF